MGKITIIQGLKQWIAGIGWRLFLWGNNTTAEEYWKQIYEQEKALNEPLNF